MSQPISFEKVRFALSQLVSSLNTEGDEQVSALSSKLKEVLLQLDTLMEQHSGGEGELKAHTLVSLPVNEQNLLKRLSPLLPPRSSSKGLGPRAVRRDDRQSKKRQEESSEEEDATPD